MSEAENNEAYMEAVKEAIKHSSAVIDPEDALELAANICLYYADAIQKQEPYAYNSIKSLREAGHSLDILNSSQS